MATLKVDDRSRHGRSSSKSGRNKSRSRSRSNIHTPEAPDAPRTAYPHYQSTVPSYELRSPTHDDGAYSTRGVPYPADNGGYTMGGYTDYPPEQRPGYTPPQAYYMPPMPRSDEEDLAYGSEATKVSAIRGRDPLSRTSSYNSSAAYKYAPTGRPDPENAPQKYQYAPTPGKVSYNSMPQSNSQPVTYSSAPQGAPHKDLRFSSTPAGQFRDQLPRTYSHNTYDQDAHLTDRHEALKRNNSTSKIQRRSDGGQTSTNLTPHGLGPQMERLSVSGHRPDVGGFLPPPSPLLEAYRGTYQSISPMPLAIRPDDDLDYEDLPPLSPGLHRTRSTGSTRLDKDLARRDRASSGVSFSSSGGKKKVKVYDPEHDAKVIAGALSHSLGKIDADALCDTLPHLSHDQILAVQKEYKKQVTVQGKGVNLSKHINVKLTGNFKKAAYVTALGKYASEGYWANFFYQSHGSRRELLIEALMGRSNAEVEAIIEGFKDGKYSDDLKNCMKQELKMDKFRTAVLMTLEARRQAENDVYPIEYLHRDVDTLYHAIHAERGGESTILEIVVRRSDTHLREVLRVYERTFNSNFAREALNRSNNLVGEVVAHILNGVINKPARDALLLEHAIRDIADKNREDELRYELLISRVVRIHWDRPHLKRVKKNYYDKYHITLEDAIHEATKGDFREFMCELCDTEGSRS